ncbi:MAG: adenylate/guanylate cyclase domain-containing protein [Actinomycetota bacterium]|nr:adenylate/guanylate cyclase domain-containing protein [Actinomycetota bacterium]
MPDRRAARMPIPSQRGSDEYWRKVLQGEVRGLRQLRRLNRLLPGKERCKSCHVPLSGLGAQVMRVVGRRPYEKNPRFCNWCMRAFQVRPGGAEIELSMVFADVRGSSALAKTMTAAQFGQLMNRFYSVATGTLVRTDAFIDKLVGDEVIGLYIPGYAGPDHADKAVRAAQELLSALGYGKPEGPWLPAGIGVHTGLAYVGTVQGTEGTVNDVTALGDTVNTAARLVSLAGSGEVLISEETFTAARMNALDLPRRTVQLKGKGEPFGVRVLGT